MKTPKKAPSSSPTTHETLLATLNTRFEKFPQRHPGLSWVKVLARLEAKPESLSTLQKMEETGGEPDVIGQDAKTGEIVFCDCSPETPKGRTSVCFDRAGWESRKEHRPQDNAIDMAASIGIEILDESQYRHLQTLGEFDLKTSSWIQTPADIRKLGGALFGDRRFGHVFVYHNGAQSYYGARAFRGSVKI